MSTRVLPCCLLLMVGCTAAHADWSLDRLNTQAQTASVKLTAGGMVLLRLP